MNHKFLIFEIIVFLFFCLLLNINTLYFMKTEDFFYARRSKAISHLQSLIKDFMAMNDYPQEIEIDKMVEYINQRSVVPFSVKEVLSVFRGLMFNEEIPEYFEIVDKDTAQSTGILKQREAVHRDGDWHLAVSILIFDKDGNLLIQKRAPHVAEPNRWEVSTSGHLAPGESPREAIIRELEEELGLNINPNNLVSIGEMNQFIKIGRKDIDEDHFEGNIYYHHSEYPSNNVERLSLFMYVVSDEEKSVLLERFQNNPTPEVSEIKFEKMGKLLEDFQKHPRSYSSAFAMYFSQDYVIHAQAQNLQNVIKKYINKDK